MGPAVIRVSLDGSLYHTIFSAHPGGLVIFDCTEQVSYQRMHLTTGDVPVVSRCPQCEQKRLAAVEYFVEGAVAGLEGDDR